MIGKNIPAQSEADAGNSATKELEQVTQQSESKPTKPETLSFRSRMQPDAERDGISVIADRRRNAYLRVGNRRTLWRLDGPKGKSLLLQSAASRGTYLRPHELREWIEHLTVCAQVAPVTHDVWLRVAPTADGIEIDIGDEDDRRIRASASGVRIVSDESEAFFHRTQPMRPFAMPAEEGDLRLLDRYLNVHDVDRSLLIAWISYTLAHPKVVGTAYLILVLNGGQGSGKSTLCRRIQMLLDPCIVGVQTFPRNEREFAVATQLSHVVFYDNVRFLRPEMSDALCRASTGNELAVRKLYTDADVVTLPMHGALVLNGINAFVNQADLGQRCLQITLEPIAEASRRSDRVMAAEFERDLPRIFRGLLDLIAGVLAHLPAVEPTCPERMIDFVHWIAAMERFHGIPGDPFQTAYSAALDRGMGDNLTEIPLAAAVLELVDGETRSHWSGTPSELLDALCRLTSRRAQGSSEWPPNAISLSRRLAPLVSSLQRQGVEIRFERGRERRITITREEGNVNE